MNGFKSTRSAGRSISAALDAMMSARNHHLETSWIAASGKAELYLRDRLGATLAKQHPDLTISREWNKHDLVVLDGIQRPLAIVEGKHFYDFDVLVPHLRGRYLKWLKEDKRKMKGSESPIQLISLSMTSLRGHVPAELRKVVKYSPGSNRQFKVRGESTMTDAVAEVPKFLSELGRVIHHRELSRGSAFGIPVHVWFWLVDVRATK